MYSKLFFKTFARSTLYALLAVTIALAFVAAMSNPVHAAPINQTEATQMKAHVGQLVVIKSSAINLQSNGTGSHPAVITRSWNTADIMPGGTATGMVNVSVQPDAGHHVIPVTSVTLYATERDGDAATSARDGVRNGVTFKAQPHFAYFAGCGNADLTDEEYALLVSAIGTPLVPITRPDGTVDTAA